MEYRGAVDVEETTREGGSTVSFIRISTARRVSNPNPIISQGQLYFPIVSHLSYFQFLPSVNIVVTSILEHIYLWAYPIISCRQITNSNIVGSKGK